MCNVLGKNRFCDVYVFYLIIVLTKQKKITSESISNLELLLPNNNNNNDQV